MDLSPHSIRTCMTALNSKSPCVIQLGLPFVPVCTQISASAPRYAVGNLRSASAEARVPFRTTITQSISSRSSAPMIQSANLALIPLVIKYAERPLHNVEERRRLVTQFSDQRLHLRGMLNGRSSPCTNESTVDDKPASVYRQYRSSDATPVWHPCHGRRTVL